MTAEHIDHDKLQMFFDRELHAGEATIVERHLAECEPCKTQLRRLERLHAMFTADAQVRASAADAKLGADLFAKIDAGIQKNDAVPASERLRVVTSEVFEHRRGLVVSIGAALAAAAVVLVILSSQPAPDFDPSAGGVAQQNVLPAPRPHGGSTVLNVDFGSHAGTVFQVESQQGSDVAVVWIEEQGDGTNGETP